MIINSKFKDYYDYFAHQYRDEKVIYNRVTERYNVNKYQEFIDFIETYTCNYYYSNFGMTNIDDRVSLLLIAGRIFPFRYYTNDTSKYEKKYDFKNPYKFINDNKHKYKYRWKFKKLKQVSSGERIPQALKFCREIAPIIYINGDKLYNPETKRYVYVVIKNPCLKDFSPPISTWEIYQELMGILASKEPNIPEMTNKNKIDSHGYDKYSFRPKMK